MKAHSAIYHTGYVLRLARYFIVALVFFCVLASDRGMAASPEKRSLTDAVNYFKDKFYPQAETRFSSFAATYTNSTERPSAILYQARSRLYQSNYVGAIDLLRTQLPTAGALADQYYYWIGESFFGQGLFQAAADTHANLIKNFPQSSLRLAAAFGQAQAHSKLWDWSRVVTLLNNSDGAFQLSAKEQPRSEFALSGFLLLGEALFAQQKYSECEKVVTSISAESLNQKLAWHRQHLLCRMQLAGGRAEEALQACTNRLFTLAAGQQSDILAESFFLQGEILEKLGRLQEAAEVYTNNLAEKLPPGIQRQALLKTITLTLKRDQTPEAIKRLEAFTEQRTNDPALDLARLTLGELALKAYYSAPDPGTNSASVAGTNRLLKAMTNFDRVIQDYPDSQLRGKAFLDRGWCFWAQDKTAEAKTNFMAALDALSQQPFSEDHVVARFKLADAQFSQRDFGAAVTNYTLVLQQCEKMPSLKERLFYKALYQILRASIERDDLPMADETVNKLVALYPPASFSDESLLLFGEYKNRKDSSAEARQVFADLIKKFPKTPVLPEVQYAIARTYAQEQDWSSAARSYDQWVTNYAQHPLLPQAEFSRALAYDKSGNETNALILFTNFVARFPSNSLSALAQNWVADYYFNDEKYVDAEINYQLVYQKNFPAVGALAYQAQLMAGRSAFARQGPKDIEDARKYFTAIVEDTNTPPALVAQAYFALGDTDLQLFLENPDSTNNFCNAAVNDFSRIVTTAPNSPLAPLAMGRIGDCHFRWAEKTPPPLGLKGLTNAIQAYQEVLKMPQASVSACSQALVQLGAIAERQGSVTNITAAERQSCLNNALEYYLKVLYETDPERFDPVWVKEAGIAAAHLCESRELWEQAIYVYNRVLTAIPSLRPALQKKIAAASARIEAAKK